LGGPEQKKLTIDVERKNDRLFLLLFFECRQVSGLISSSGQDEGGSGPIKSGWSKNTKKEKKFLILIKLIPERDGNSTLAIPIQQDYHVSQ
jgi:hypothetical protein